jgi:glucose/arabinose dehydrogenase
MLAFDRDGFFRMAIGNGGFHDASGQTDTLHGKILRLDLDADEQPYGIPPGNVQGVGVRPEIWASGLRNPWRFSIDACTGDMYIGDVGGDYEEEIDVEPYGSGPSEYGFPYFEGTMCGDPPCTHEGDIKPVVSYRREARNCAVMGGFVYRGHAMPGLLGTYLYADHCSGRFWAFEYDGTASNHREITSIINPDPGLRQISSFGQDALGELYVTGFSSGAVYRIDPQ